jgi:diguanylate cyclase (GGDEF)-like protein
MHQYGTTGSDSIQKTILNKPAMRGLDLELSPPMTAASAPAVAADETVLDPRSLLSSLGEVVYTWDIDSDNLQMGPNAKEVLKDVPLGCTGKGLAFARLVEPGSGRSRYDAVMDSGAADIGDGVPYHTRYAVNLNGRKMWADDNGRWFAGADGRPARARGVLRIERQVRDEELDSQNHELSDRITLVQSLEAAMAEQLPAGRSVVVLVAAIDELTRLNDDFGHEATDEIIGVAQNRLRSVMRRRDRLVRYSGNRFAITLVGCPPDQVIPAARRFARAVAASAIETSRGIALIRLRTGAGHAPTLTRNAGALLAAAEAALNTAKLTAANDAVIAQASDLRSARKTARTLDFEAIDALNARRVHLARQPIVEARSRVLSFHEALVRVVRADGVVIPPAELLPVLERRGLVRLIDHRVLELAFEGLVQEPQTRLSINVSPQSMRDPEWLETFVALTRLHKDTAERIVVEITETATIDDTAATRRILDVIKGQGSRVAIDDFGAGHTSLKHLRQFPIDILKMDGAFTQSLQRSPDDRFFVRTLIDLAQHLEVETVAEWVDDPATADMLADWGITYLQGNLTGAAADWKPLTGLPMELVPADSAAA